MQKERLKNLFENPKQVIGLLGAVAAVAYIGIAGALDAHGEAVRDAAHIAQQLEQSPSPIPLEDD